MKQITYLLIAIFLLLISIGNVNAKVSYYDNIISGYHFNQATGNYTDVKNLMNFTYGGGYVNATTDKNGVSNSAFNIGITASSCGYIKTGNFASFNTTKNWSISFWVASINNYGNDGMITKSNLASNYGDFHIMSPAVNSYFSATTIANKVWWGTSTPLSVHHLVYTYTTTNSQGCIYIDTVLQNCTNALGMQSNNISLALGTHYRGSATGVCGNNWFDELIITNTTLAQAEINETYLAYDTWDSVNTTASINNITFLNQSPINITVSSLYNEVVNITYNYINETTSVNNRTLNYTLISDEIPCIVTVNGSCQFLNNTYKTLSPTTLSYSTTNSNATFNINENNIYPSIENLNYTYFNTSNFNNLTAQNDFVSIMLTNISNNSNYNIFEIMATSTNDNKLYACNNSYSFGSLVTTNINCQEIGSINTLTFNHSHSTTNKHNNIAFTILNGKIGGNGIKVTPTMYFMYRGATSSIGTYYYVNTTTTTNTTRTTTNGGNTWTVQPYTVNAHLHFYPIGTNLNFKYKGSAIFNATLQETSLTTEIIDFTVFPPTPPIITNPLDTIQSTRYINITWNNATANYPSGIIQQYNISLFYNNVYNRTITSFINGTSNITKLISTNTTATGSTSFVLIKTLNINGILDNSSTYLQQLVNATGTSYSYAKVYLYNGTIINTTIGTTPAGGPKSLNVTIDVTNNLLVEKIEIYARATAVSIVSYITTDNIKVVYNNKYIYDLYNQNLSIDNYQIQMCALDGLSQSSCDIETFNLTRNALLNVSAYDYSTNETLSNININITNYDTSISESWNTTGETVSIDIIKNNNYGITFDVNNYAFTTTNITTISASFQSLNQSLYKTNSINIIFYKESAGTIINNVTCNLTLQGTSTTTSYGTSNGYIFISNLTADNYTAVGICTLYTQRQYFITVTDRSTQTLYIFLLENPTDVLFSYTDKDTGVVLENVLVGLSKYVNGSLTLVESRLTDVTGRTQFNVATNTLYVFTSTKSGYVTKQFTLNPVIFTSYNVQLTKDSTTITPLDYKNIAVTVTPSKYVIGNNSFIFTITSSDGELVEYGYNLTSSCNNTGGSGVNLYGGTLTKSYPLSSSCITNYGVITLNYYYETSDGTRRNFTQLYGIVSDTNTTTISTSMNSGTYGMGLFERIVITTILVLILVGVVSSVAGMVGGLFVGLIVLGFLVSTGFIPIGVIILTLFASFVLIVSFSRRS